MKFQPQRQAAPPSVYYASLTSLARAAVKEAASGHDCLNIIDGAKLVDNYCSLKSTGLTPLIKAVDMAGEMGNLLADQVEEAPFLVFNKPEIVSALDLGIDPAKLAFIAGVKPAPAIKYGLKRGLRVFGGGSVADIDKIGKAKLTTGLSDTTLDLVLVFDPTDLPSYDTAMQMVGMTYEQGDKLAGISVQSTEPFCDESFAKTVALSRLVIEASAQKNLLQGNEKRIIFDIGEVDLNEKNYVKRGEIARKQLTGTGVKLACQASAMVTKGAVGVAVKVTAVQRHAVIVNESIYGAFSGLLVGNLKLQQPQLVRAGVQKYDNKQSGVRYEVLGCSGADDDVIFQETEIGGLPFGQGLRLGDWLLFPDVVAPTQSVLTAVSSSSHAAGCPRSPVSPPSPWMTLDISNCGTLDNDISDLENLFSLPDLTEEALETMFNI